MSERQPGPSEHATSTRAVDEPGSATQAEAAASAPRPEPMLGALSRAIGSPLLQRKLQRRAAARAAGGAPPSSEAMHEAAARGVEGAGGALPHLDRIQASFGRHDVGGVRAFVGGAAGDAAGSIGAEAYATGDRVAFAGTPDLHTAAHEAAHVVQQRGGVQLKGGVGAADDEHERHADAVADQVVAGRSAEALLDERSGAQPAAGGGALQRKSLKQAGLDTGLEDAGPRRLESYQVDGQVYAEELDANLADRTAALAKAAERNAVIGKRTEGKTWTDENATFGDNGANTLDPFMYRVTVPFTHDGEDDHLLELLFQHAPRWTGYVTRLQDSSNQHAQERVTMHQGRKLRSSDKFSNRHDTSDNSAIAGQTDGGGEKNLDAYTKIAGEGARWQCVRTHASKIQNNTYFFVQHPTNSAKVLGLSFEKLWKNWKFAFDKKYDITDGVVATAIRDGGRASTLREDVDKSALGAKDYNLETGAAHVVAPVVIGGGGTTGGSTG